MLEENRGKSQRKGTPEGLGVRVREYGRSGPRVVLVHGGPGAMGTLAPVARELSRTFRVLEPLQRRSGGTPLTVARHVEDLHAVLRERCRGERPAVLGHSWGAMLALCTAAAHPGCARLLVLVGCGTFDRASREALRAERDRRMDDRLREGLARLAVHVTDPDERLRRMGDLLLPVDSVDPLPEDPDPDPVRFDERAYRESWNDMLRQQDRGIYPAAFSAVSEPVLMIHGARDPHPGRMILGTLRDFVPDLEYRELPRCGHYPWMERGARDAFYRLVRERLAP